MSPALNRELDTVQGCPPNLESVFEVLHCAPVSRDIGLDHQHPAHKIGQFVEESFQVDLILDYLLSLTEGIETKTTNDEDKEKKKEEEEEKE